MSLYISQMERFRNRVIQATYSSPGIDAPDTEVTDDELMSALKQLLEERVTLRNQAQDMQDQVDQAKRGTDELVAQGHKLKDDINNALVRAMHTLICNLNLSENCYLNFKKLSKT